MFTGNFTLHLKKYSLALALTQTQNHQLSSINHDQLTIPGIVIGCCDYKNFIHETIYLHQLQQLVIF